ncbi:MAG: hypothetical protein ACTH93_04170 [Pseudoclavibacter sp.]
MRTVHEVEHDKPTIRLDVLTSVADVLGLTLFLGRTGEVIGDGSPSAGLPSADDAPRSHAQGAA